MEGGRGVMKNGLGVARKFLLVGCALLGSVHSGQTAEYFSCACDDGADPDCQPGNDDDAGTSPAQAWGSYERARQAFSSMSAGDSISFCRGGQFTLTAAAASTWVNGQCTAQSPCEVGSYVPDWASGDEGPPRIHSEGANAFDLANGGNAVPQAGYWFRDLELTCTGCEQTFGQGFFLFNDVDDVRIESVTIDGFAIGVHVAGANPCGGDPGCDGSNDRLQLLNSRLVNNSGQGFLGGGNETQIEGCYFQNNGTQPVFEHNLYLAGVTTGSRILNNQLYQSSIRASGACQSSSLVVHGVHQDLVISGNEVWEDVGAAEPNCWGITVDAAYDTPESFTDVVISGNVVRNVGNVAIGVSSCVDCWIENNVVIHEQAFGATAIAVPNRPRVDGDAINTGTVVRNNSISVGAGGGTGIYLGDEGSAHQVVSNALQFWGNTRGNSGWSCLEANLGPTAYQSIDYNVCGYESGRWSSSASDLSEWQSLGWGAHSVANSPGFVSATDLGAAEATAPMVDAGDPQNSTATDPQGTARGASPDAGAYEWSGGNGGTPTPTQTESPTPPLPTNTPTVLITATPTQTSVPTGPTETPILPEPTETPSPSATAPPLPTEVDVSKPKSSWSWWILFPLFLLIGSSRLISSNRVRALSSLR